MPQSAQFLWEFFSAAVSYCPSSEPFREHFRRSHAKEGGDPGTDPSSKAFIGTVPRSLQNRSQNCFRCRVNGGNTCSYLSSHLLMSHTLDVLSMEQEAKKSPHVCQEHPHTAWVWSARVRTHSVLEKSQIFTVPSPDEVARRAPLKYNRIEGYENGLFRIIHSGFLVKARQRTASFLDAFRTWQGLLVV